MNRRAGIAGLFALLATLWGLSFLAIEVGLRTLAPVLFAAFRYDVAAVCLLGYAVVRTTAWQSAGGRNLAAIAAGGVFLVAGNAFLFVGQQTVPSGVAAILQSLVPVVTTLWAFGILPEERVSAVGAAGIAVGFLGVALIVRPDPGNLLGAAVVGRLLILAQVASLVVGEEFALPTTVEGTAAVVYLGIFATALAFFIYFTLLEVRGAVETSLVAYLVPLVATAVGVVVLGEAITPLTIVGFLVVFLGFVLLKRRAFADLVSDVETVSRLADD